jgi:hypothetical protein
MIEEALFQYGSLGLFTAYLIYDRQVTMAKLIKVIEDLTEHLKK